MSKHNFLIISILLSAGIIAVGVFWYLSIYNQNQPNSYQTDNYLNGLIIENNLEGNTIIGRPTNNSVTLNILAEKGSVVYVDYGTDPTNLNLRSANKTSVKGESIIIELNDLLINTEYYYQVNLKNLPKETFTTGEINSFNTQRISGSTFSFGVQGDSHPERVGKMFNSALYYVTMQNVSINNPDLYFTLGDDFSIEGLIEKNNFTQSSVNQIYLEQRKYLGIIGKDTSLFLVNGNHEQAAKYLLDGTTTNPAILAGIARTSIYSLPTPNNFYGGDTEKVEGIDYLSDYYSFEWGDALFVVIDPYWHSEVAVDNTAGTSIKPKATIWDSTLGDTQYQWFKNTLENSNAKFKFVFTHHVLGTGRGGIEEANLGEWGGYNQQGVWEFNEMRPSWELPIHQLMVKNGVTIFFQGHDHLFAKQELDGIIYQEVPSPADDTYSTFNKVSYKSGIVLSNSGYLNVTVNNSSVKVEYIRSGNNIEDNYSYTISK